jgi:hypothetical protein
MLLEKSLCFVVASMSLSEEIYKEGSEETKFKRKAGRRMLLGACGGLQTFEAFRTFPNDKNLEIVERFLTFVKRNSIRGGFVFFLSVKLVEEGVINLGRRIFYNSGFSACGPLGAAKERINEGLRVYQNDSTNHLILRFRAFDRKTKRYREIRVPRRV